MILCVIMFRDKPVSLLSLLSPSSPCRFLMWTFRLPDWENVLPQIPQWWGFSPDRYANKTFRANFLRARTYLLKDLISYICSFITPIIKVGCAAVNSVPLTRMYEHVFSKTRILRKRSPTTICFAKKRFLSWKQPQNTHTNFTIDDLNVVNAPICTIRW